MVRKTWMGNSRCWVIA